LEAKRGVEKKKHKTKTQESVVTGKEKKKKLDENRKLETQRVKPWGAGDREERRGRIEGDERKKNEGKERDP